MLDDDELLSLDRFQVMPGHFMDGSESYPSCANQNGRDALGSVILGTWLIIYGMIHYGMIPGD